uniref:Putative secreted peptide n=1 Tax=Hyalomma excavatum TaxID=257692 RepID=A0A131XE89_9ACAR
MKTAVVLVLVACFVATATSAKGRAASRREQFDEWRNCMVQKIPNDKASVYQACHERSRGTDMHRFRDGLQCVLSSYNIVNRNDVNLERMAQLAREITQQDLKSAFEECPKNERNKQLQRTVKCVIDHLESTCPVPEGAAGARE